MSEESVWIYHERQQAALCGQHALNNLCQAALFTADYLASLAHDLDVEELSFYGPVGSPSYMQRLREGSSNVDSTGNFSLQVLCRALNKKLNIELPNIVEESVRNQEPTEFSGFICHKQAHWFAIRKINGHFWNLNSFLSRPETISHFRLAAEISSLQKKDYSIFVAVPSEGLPPICLKESERQRGKMKYWWKESLLLKDQSVSSANRGINYTNTAEYSYEDTSKLEVEDKANATQDPWLNAGKGQKLSNLKPTTKTVSTRNNNNNNSNNKFEEENLTEEEQLQKAIEKSLENQNSSSQVEAVAEEIYEELKIVEEPSKSASQVSKLQLRLPNNKAIVRCFNMSDKVKYLYAVVKNLCDKEGLRKQGVLQLSAGFPLKPLTDGDKTLEEEGLMNARVTSKWL